MDKQQKLKLALPLLLIVMFFVWKPVFTGPGKNKGKEQSGTKTAAAVSSAAISQADLAVLVSASQKQRSKTAFQDWGRNPFVLGQKRDALMVEGILWDAQNPNVMINGNILGVGGTVEGVTVVEIKPQSVILRDADGDVELGPGESK